MNRFFTFWWSLQRNVLYLVDLDKNTCLLFSSINGESYMRLVIKFVATYFESAPDRNLLALAPARERLWWSSAASRSSRWTRNSFWATSRWLRREPSWGRTWWPCSAFGWTWSAAELLVGRRGKRGWCSWRRCRRGRSRNTGSSNPSAACPRCPGNSSRRQSGCFPETIEGELLRSVRGQFSVDVERKLYKKVAQA